MSGYDIIGDVHGHAETLRQLLTQLGYRPSGDGFRHPDRQVVFVGDFIDRGPSIADSIRIARATVEDGHGLAVIGNHEFNAIAFHTPRPNSAAFFRPHNDGNRRQHQATLDQLTSRELHDALHWFRTLPVALDLDGVRVVHAAWQPADIRTIESALAHLGPFTVDFLLQACAPHAGGGMCPFNADAKRCLFCAVENILKGPEVPLPDGIRFHDKYGAERSRTRIRWYADPTNETLRSYAIGAGDDLPASRIPPEIAGQLKPYPSSDPPVFFGHYWLQGTPEPLASNVACVDYSVASHGRLCAYQWNSGDTCLTADRFQWVAAPPA